MIFCHLMQTCIITGGNAGIGFASATAMMRRGCNIILACRNMQKAEAAVQASGIIAYVMTAFSITRRCLKLG